MWKPRVYLWLEIVLNFFYFTFLSPYRFQFNENTESYECVSGVFHTVLVAAVHISGILQTGFGLYHKTHGLKLGNPKCIFHSAVAHTRYIIYFSVILTLWIKRSHFKAFFDSYYPSLEKSKDNWKAKIFTWFLCVMSCIVAVSIELLGFSETHGQGFSVNTLINFFQHGGPKKVFQNYSIGPLFPSAPTSMQSAYVVDGLTVLYNIALLYARVCNHLAMIFCVLAAVTIYQAVSAFTTTLDKKRSQELVIHEFIEFNQFESLLNSACGWVIFGAISCSPSFFIVYLIDILNNTGATGPRIIYYSFYYCIIFGFAAVAANKVDELKEWILENGEGANEIQLFALFVEVSNNPLGLSGMNCFTITYGLVSKILGMIVTFTIIILQFETTPKNPIIDSICTV